MMEMMMAATALLSTIGATAEIARAAWEPFWPQWKRRSGHPNADDPCASKHACIPSAFALSDILNRLFPEFRWRVVGGRPTKQTPLGGYLDAEGVPHGHFWVVGRRGKNQVWADVTGDQFGGPPVLIMLDGATRFQANATRLTINDFRSCVRDTVATMVELFDRSSGDTSQASLT
jgi:hypothetical protein